jgi:uncharacterized protein YjaG (DUF416 family)
MLPVYRWFHDRTGQGDPAALEQALEDLWTAVKGEGRSPESLESQQHVAEELVPHEDDRWVDECAYAENATAAVAYAIRSWLTGSAQEAAWAARQLYDALDYRVTNRDDLDLNAPRVHELIDADQLIQRELARQQNDVEVLRHATWEAINSVAMQLRERARTDGRAMFDFMLE